MKQSVFLLVSSQETRLELILLVLVRQLPVFHLPFINLCEVYFVNSISILFFCTLNCVNSIL